MIYRMRASAYVNEYQDDVCVYTLKQIVVIRRAQSESHSFAGNWTILIKKQEKLGCFIC